MDVQASSSNHPVAMLGGSQDGIMMPLTASSQAINVFTGQCDREPSAFAQRLPADARSLLWTKVWVPASRSCILLLNSNTTTKPAPTTNLQLCHGEWLQKVGVVDLSNNIPPAANRRKPDKEGTVNGLRHEETTSTIAQT
ncbi:hypothetical protein H633G_03068 [Metarhizium anisopliae BRIP 53284]|nr:hypothetical protein H633G_03068 [Metarhizium anisopliae BRIP 53284]